VPPGLIDSANAAAGQAQGDLMTAYNVLAALPATEDLTGQDLGGLTLTPGVYDFSSSAQLTGTLTLNAEGSDDAVWIFQIGSTLTTASASDVQVINGGPGDGVFWDVGSSATLGTGTVFEGNILATTSITLATGAIIPCGRALAENGAVTMDTNVVSTACTATAGWDAAQSVELSGINGDLGTGLDLDNLAAPEPGSLTLLIAASIAFLINAIWVSKKKPAGWGRAVPSRNS
jgi:type VI secretion system secreted protein VgrG